MMRFLFEFKTKIDPHRQKIMFTPQADAEIESPHHRLDDADLEFYSRLLDVSTIRLNDFPYLHEYEHSVFDPVRILPNFDRTPPKRFHRTIWRAMFRRLIHRHQEHVQQEYEYMRSEKKKVIASRAV